MFSLRSLSLAPLALVALGTLAVGVGAGLAMGGDGRGDRDLSSDPTVGTLPLQAGAVDDVPGPDQVLYLTGHTSQVRAVLAAAALRYEPGQCSMGVWPLPHDRVWVELHGTFDLSWSDPSVLEAVEVGVGAGFEGGGLFCVVETYIGSGAPYLVETGRTMQFDLARLRDAGLLDRPVVLRGAHRNGVRTRLEFESTAGALTVRQRV